MSAVSGRPWSFCTAASDAAPVAPAICDNPMARATSMPLRIEWIQDEQEYGITMPVVPRIDNPPTMPSRPLRVRAASASPSGIAISTSTSPAAPMLARQLGDDVGGSSGAATGLIAGSPGAIGRPGRVTVPTPGPARKVTPLPGRAGPHRRQHQGPMGDVGIVARVLDDAGSGAVRGTAGGGEHEGRALAVRQRDLDRIGKAPVSSPA